MELSTQTIHTNNILCHSDMQITLEDDINVPDTKPDIEQLIKNQGQIQLSSITPTEDKVILKGYLSFSLLYITTEDIRPVHNMKGKIPFEESINMEGFVPHQEVLCHFELEDCQANLINSRKVSVQAIVSFHCCQEEETKWNAGVDIISSHASRADMDQVTPIEGLHCKYDQFDFTHIVQQKKDILRIKDQLNLPKGKPNIDTVLYYDMNTENMQNRIVDGGVRFTGDLQIFLLYIPENEERRLEFLETELPFDGMIPCSNITEDMVSDIETVNTSHTLEIRGDEDGESRVLELEFNINMILKFYEEVHFPYLEDAYATTCSLELHHETVTPSMLLLKNQSVVRVSDRIHVNQDNETILQLCNSAGTVQIDEQSVVENGIAVEGVVNVDILYITENDARPLAVAKGTIPFTHTIEIKGIHPEDDYELQTALNQISVIMLDSQEIEAKVVLELCAFVFTHKERQIITKIAENPLDLEKLQNMPGLVGLIADRNMDLWNIAKEYNTTVESIMDLNQLESDHISTGDHLLIMKEMDGF